jgi:hypothetical protein
MNGAACRFGGRAVVTVTVIAPKGKGGHGRVLFLQGAQGKGGADAVPDHSRPCALRSAL